MTKHKKPPTAVELARLVILYDCSAAVIDYINNRVLMVEAARAVLAAERRKNAR